MVVAGSGADKAGIIAGDIITAVNEESLSAENAHDATALILDFMRGVEEGDVLEVEYLRDGKVGSVEVEPRAVEMHAFRFGGFPKDFSVPAMPEAPLSPEAAEHFRHKFAYAWSGNAWSDMELVELNEGLGKYFGADSGVLVVAFVFGLVNALLKPIVLLFSLPFLLLSLGLFTFVVNGVMLMVTAGLTDALSVSGLWAAVLGSLVISIVSTILGWVLKDERKKKKD